jgi:thiol-disulfide isomerase/thioredoxin
MRDANATARLTVLALIASLFLPACPEDTPAAPESLSRVNAVRAHGRPPSVDDFCDAHASATDAKIFAWPALASGAAAPRATPGRWRWVNLWATWCRPCLSEMPMVFSWKDRLTAAGHPVDVQLLSVDASNDEVEQYQGLHSEVNGTVRMAEPGAVQAYLTSLGLDGGASIPVHVFVDPAGKVRCVRAGAISEDDFDDVQLVVSQ